ncbi:MAG TPA: quinoprotein relay system zinc metallohydrolase 1 [Methyloversatilis sp.]
MIARLVSLLLLAAAAFVAQAADFDYGLRPQQVAEDSWVLIGRTEDITRQNGGNIVNASFVVTRDGVVVIDTGPSRRYGEQMKAAIATVTDRPVVRVFNTHHHPDHFLGNQAFDGVPLQALPATQSGMRDQGGAFADNMYRMAGDWLAGTDAHVAPEPAHAGRVSIGGHDFELLALDGHTAGDLAVFDRTTGVLYAGDLIFLDRAPTTPHAALAHWRRSLDVLSALPVKRTVPGHGPVHDDGRGIAQTRDWLDWLDATFGRAAAEGLDMAEVMRLPLPPRFERMPLARSEFERSVTHLYGAYEQQAMNTSAQRHLQQK